MITSAVYNQNRKMFPYTDFKSEQPGLGNGWDPTMSQVPPAGYIPPSNTVSVSPQTTAISSSIPPHQNKYFLTDNDYYGGEDVQETNGFEPATLPAEGNQYFLTQNDYYAENRQS